MEHLSILSKEDLHEVFHSLMSATLEDVLKNHQPANENPLLTREEAAMMLDISLPTLLQWEKDGTIPKPKRLGKRVYFVRKSFIQFLEEDNNQTKKS